MADYSKLTKRELIMTLYARDLMLENERKRLEEYKQSLNETIDHYEKYCSEINHQNIMLYASARNYENQLALTEKALELVCDCFYNNFGKALEPYCECNTSSEAMQKHFKTKAKEMMKSE